MFRKIMVMAITMAALAVVTGCGSITKPNAENWVLPKKENAESGMIIGRIDYPISTKENPKGERIFLTQANFMAKKVYFNRNGETNIVLDNNYFVVPNVAPGKYWFMSFQAGKLYNQLPIYADEYLIEVKAGEIKFAGSYDYLLATGSFLWAESYKFNIKKASSPSERDMFEWLNRVGAGSGWEPAIKKRLRELGGRP